jgi:hypothetical protein
MVSRFRVGMRQSYRIRRHETCVYLERPTKIVTNKIWICRLNYFLLIGHGLVMDTFLRTTLSKKFCHQEIHKKTDRKTLDTNGVHQLSFQVIYTRINKECCFTSVFALLLLSWQQTEKDSHVRTVPNSNYSPVRITYRYRCHRCNVLSGDIRRLIMTADCVTADEMWSLWPLLMDASRTGHALVWKKADRPTEGNDRIPNFRQRYLLSTVSSTSVWGPCIV